MDIAVVDAGGNLKAHVIRMDGAFIGSINIPIKKLTLPSLCRMRPKTLHRWSSLVRSCSTSVMLPADESSFSLGRSTGLCYKAVRGGERDRGARSGRLRWWDRRSKRGSDAKYRCTSGRATTLALKPSPPCCGA